VGLVSIGLIWLSIENVRAGAELNSRLEKLRAEGEPLSIADLLAQMPTEGQNALTYFDRAKEGCDAIESSIGKVAESKEGKQLSEQLHSEQAFSNSDLMIDAYRNAFANHPEVTGLLEDASRCSYIGLQKKNVTSSGSFMAEFLPVAQLSRSAIRVLNYRVHLLIADGKPSEAIETCIAMFRICELCNRFPALVGQLVANACRAVALRATEATLQSGQLAPADYERIEAALAAVKTDTAFRESLRFERAYGLEMFSEDGARTLYMRLPIGKRDQASYLDAIEAALAVAERPSYDPGADEDLENAFKDTGPLTSSMAPGLQATRRAIAESTAKIHCMRTLIAILQHPPEDEKPVDLTSLALPIEATIDPLNGQPLRAKHTDAGWLVYSVGKNLQDDGGKLDDDRTDVGVGPIELTPSR
jgi:hypothetical protein